MPQRHNPAPLTSSAATYESWKDGFRPIRNGRPAGPGYIWQGDRTGMSEAEVTARLAAARASLDACEAVDGPDPEAYREAYGLPIDVPGWERLRREAEPPRPAASTTGPRAATNGEPSPAPAGDPARCGQCGYLTARCSCPGGPRWGSA